MQSETVGDIFSHFLIKTDSSAMKRRISDMSFFLSRSLLKRITR